MKRNPEATCSTCPFYAIEENVPAFGECRAHSPISEKRIGIPPEYWCGDHPDLLLPAGGRSELGEIHVIPLSDDLPKSNESTSGNRRRNKKKPIPKERPVSKIDESIIDGICVGDHIGDIVRKVLGRPKGTSLGELPINRVKIYVFIPDVFWPQGPKPKLHPIPISAEDVTEELDVEEIIGMTYGPGIYHYQIRRDGISVRGFYGQCKIGDGFSKNDILSSFIPSAPTIPAPADLSRPVPAAPRIPSAIEADGPAPASSEHPSEIKYDALLAKAKEIAKELLALRAADASKEISSPLADEITNVVSEMGKESYLQTADTDTLSLYWALDKIVSFAELNNWAAINAEDERRLKEILSRMT